MDTDHAAIADRLFSATVIELEQLYGDQRCFEVTLDALQRAVPARGPSGGVGIDVLWWVIPRGWHALDGRLLRLFRRDCNLHGHRPLVIECRGLESATVQTRDQEIRRLDQLTLAIEELWETAWLHVPVAERPGLTVVRGDGAMPISADIRTIWRALPVISNEPLVTFDHITRVYGRSMDLQPSKSRISQLLGALRQQGILALERKGTRPLRYAALPTWAFRRVAHLQGAHTRATLQSRTEINFATQGTTGLMWAQLHDRLCDEGLRTIGPKMKNRLKVRG